jgi:Fic/DOC family
VELPWSEVDPQTHAFDIDLVYLAVDRVVRQHGPSFHNDSERAVVRYEITAAFVVEYGAWAEGWSSTSYIPRDQSPQAVATRALAALVAWRTHLEHLARTFAEIRIETAQYGLLTEVERAATRLLALIADRTFGEDAWYAELATVVIWYLQAGGITDNAAHNEVEALLERRFESWVLPNEIVARAACSELGAAIANRVAAPSRDALADWRIVRDQLPGRRETAYLPTLDDAHARYIELDDRARDPDRAERMAAALLVCRDAAAHSSLLTFDLLAEWQRIVLGTSAPVPLRTSDGFAKQGRERYGTYATLAEDFEHALARANDPEVPIATRAACVYLDVCFFHPFPDGNARAARLALDYVITAAGLTLRAGPPIFALSRGADDPTGLVSLERVIDHALGVRSAIAPIAQK